LRCLEKDRTKRFANIDAFAASLAAVAPARARLSIERIARLSLAGGVASRSSSQMRSPPPVDPNRTDAPPRPDMLSSADGWGTGAGPTRSDPRRRLLFLGVPAALLLVLATYWLLHRGGESRSASSAPSASGMQHAAPREPTVKPK
jgi:hypothetical protein